MDGLVENMIYKKNEKYGVKKEVYNFGKREGGGDILLENI